MKNKKNEKKIISDDELAEKLKSIQEADEGDIEKIHAEMDILFCKVLWQAGYEKSVEIFEDQRKWYA